MADKRADFCVFNGGSIFLLHTLSRAACDWADKHLPEDCPRFGTAYAIAHRFIDDIVEGITSDGLEVR